MEGDREIQGLAGRLRLWLSAHLESARARRRASAALPGPTPNARSRGPGSLASRQAVADDHARSRWAPAPGSRQLGLHGFYALYELWVADFERHEMLNDRVEVGDLRGLPVAGGGHKLGAA